MDEITHYHAQIKLPGHVFPERARITDLAMLELANHGTTPGVVRPKLRDRADRLRAALMAGRAVITSIADIYPLTAADYKAGRLTRSERAERI